MQSICKRVQNAELIIFKHAMQKAKRSSAFLSYGLFEFDFLIVTESSETDWKKRLNEQKSAFCISCNSRKRSPNRDALVNSTILFSLNLPFYMASALRLLIIFLANMSFFDEIISISFYYLEICFFLRCVKSTHNYHFFACVHSKTRKIDSVESMSLLTRIWLEIEMEGKSRIIAVVSVRTQYDHKFYWVNSDIKIKFWKWARLHCNGRYFVFPMFSLKSLAMSIETEILEEIVHDHSLYTDCTFFGDCFLFKKRSNI